MRRPYQSGKVAPGAAGVGWLCPQGGTWTEPPSEPPSAPRSGLLDRLAWDATPESFSNAA